MTEHILYDLAGIIVLGVTAQWIAWRVGVPSILLLLVIGVLAGPITGWLCPDELFGELLLPLVSLAVALILYEGGLSLKMSELKSVGRDVFRLVSIGTILTWCVIALAARWLLGFDLPLSALLAAVLIVTGPTVIGPLLRLIRPTGGVGPLLKWEGIVIDPIGAVLSVLIFEAMMIGEAREATLHTVIALGKTVVIGGGFGFAAGFLLTLALARHAIADYLENAVSLMLVVGIFTLSNHIEHESGLVAVTVMGFTLANQKRIDVEHIVEFKENLQVLLISGLFIILAARLDLQTLKSVLVPGLIFTAVLVLIARPLVVALATWRSTLSRKERIFAAWMAPRGIVAAAIASVFAIRLEAVGYPGADRLVPITFITIIVTVTVYGLTAPALAYRLGVAEANPQGILFAGAHAWARKVADLLQREGFRVLLVDNNREQIREARMAGLSTCYGNILGEYALDRINLGGLGRLLAVTPNDWVNILTVHRFERIFGRGQCYQLSPRRDQSGKREHYLNLHGRWLFAEELDYGHLVRLAGEGFAPKSTPLTETFDYAAFCQQYGERHYPLFWIDHEGHLHVRAAGEPVDPVPGDTLISLVREPEASDSGAP